MIRGQRFEVDLGSDDEDNSQASARPAVFPGAFVGDVLERKPTAPKPPTAPSMKSKTGFPEHKKRPVESRFRQRKAQVNAGRAEPTYQDASATAPATPQPAGGNAKPSSWEEDEKQRINQENQQKLAGMSQTEIEEERRELMNSLSPALIERLLKRSNIDSGSNESTLHPEAQPWVEPVPAEKTKKATTKSVKFAEPEPEVTEPKSTENATQVTEDPHPDEGDLPGDTIHFPQAPQPPELDPDSATFLEDLHEKYFPSLPADPDKLEWMQTSKSDRKAYNPAASALNAQDIRFSFTGELLPPKTASQIPVTEGLHHHGNAPDAAGYTISELAHLARSSFPAQRCIAFQTLGRILYRLGRGEFGNPGEPGVEATGAEDSFGELARGLWGVIEHDKVIETLVMESEGQGVDRGRHLSAKSYATEAVWFWRKGGGRRWKAA